MDIILKYIALGVVGVCLISIVALVVYICFYIIKVCYEDLNHYERKK